MICCHTLLQLGTTLILNQHIFISKKMSQLKTEHPDVHHHFKKGLHVVRRSDREWAGLSTDLIIEQVLCPA